MQRFCVLAILTLMGIGCESEVSLPGLEESNAPALSESRVGTAYDPANCGEIHGRVVWQGPIPPRERFLYGMPKGNGNFDIQFIDGPNDPAIDQKSRVVAGAVIFLRKLDLTRSRPWDLPPVEVEFHDRQIQVLQGQAKPARVGFAHRGEPVSMKAAEPLFHILRGRSAAFFSYTFPEPDQPITRAFDKVGRIELSSGSGYYWASADLFISDHPYFTLTDREGTFTLDHVPSGPVEVVAWLPGWIPRNRERDPESGLIVRMSYSPPVEAVRTIKVEAKHQIEVVLTVP